MTVIREIPKGYLFETQEFIVIQLVHYYIINILFHKAVGLHNFGVLTLQTQFDTVLHSFNTRVVFTNWL